jgi:copper(I)-binding protein
MPRVAALVAALLGLLAVPAHAVTIDWVTVGDAGNAADTTGASDGSKYAAKTNMGDKPVNFVSWFDAARVANWLQNGQGSGSTETGAYTLTSGTSGTAPAVNSGATFYVPTENQWYKAAFYKGSGTSAGFWDYPTGSDTAPTAVSASSRLLT